MMGHHLVTTDMAQSKQKTWGNQNNGAEWKMPDKRGHTHVIPLTEMSRPAIFNPGAAGISKTLNACLYSWGHRPLFP